MAWTAPITWTTGQVVTAAQMNQQVRDNLLETMPAKVTTKGDGVFATGANALARRGVGSDGQTIIADSAQADGVKWGSILASENRLLVLPRLEGNFNADTTVIAAAAWPTSNKGIFIPVYLAVGKTVDKIHVANGGTVSGNIDVGLYDSAGNRLQSKGSTAQSGTNAEQVFDITNQALSAKTLYYVGVAMDNATGTLIANTTAYQLQWASLGVKEASTVFALPASVSFSDINTAFVPAVCLEFTS